VPKAVPASISKGLSTGAAAVTIVRAVQEKAARRDRGEAFE
jgi:hypothetical protein